MQNSTLKRVADHSTLDITFSLLLADDTLVEKTAEGEVFQFTIGDGQFIPPLENMLIGLEEGTRAKFVLNPEDAFGQSNSDNVQIMTKADFPTEMDLVAGHVIGFNTPTGEEVPGTVVKVEEGSVYIDFNHPLAGKIVIFEATIVKCLLKVLT